MTRGSVCQEAAAAAAAGHKPSSSTDSLGPCRVAASVGDSAPIYCLLCERQVAMSEAIRALQAWAPPHEEAWRLARSVDFHV